MNDFDEAEWHKGLSSAIVSGVKVLGWAVIIVALSVVASIGAAMWVQ